MVSGRRTHPAAPLAAAQLTALAGRLTGRDRQLCRLLADHQVLTTGLLALLLDAPPRTLQQRLTTLKVVDRSRPHQPVGAASAPTTTSWGGRAAVLAADPSAAVDRSGWDRAAAGWVGTCQRAPHPPAGSQHRVRPAHPHRRHQPDTRLVCWWPAAHCQAWWGRLIAPDAYARRRDPDGEVDPSSTTPHPPAADPHGVPLERYNEPAAATGITTPVLLYAGDPDQQAQLRDRQLPVPVASSNPACGQPADPVWLPTSRPLTAGAIGSGARPPLPLAAHPTSNLHRTPGSGRRRAAPPS